MALQRQLKRFPAVLLPARLMELLPASGFRIRSGKLPVRTGATEIVNVNERSGFKIRRLLQGRVLINPGLPASIPAKEARMIFSNLARLLAIAAFVLGLFSVLV